MNQALLPTELLSVKAAVVVLPLPSKLLLPLHCTILCGLYTAYGTPFPRLCAVSLTQIAGIGPA